MKTHTLYNTMAALFVCAALGIAGCNAGQAMTDEMREQEVTMTSEANDWQRDVTSWRGQHEEMLAWYGTQMTKRDSAEARKQTEKLNEHAENISTFQAGLEEHQAALAAEHQRSEKDRVMAHAGLWAEHQRLSASYTMLASTHEGLMKAYLELREKKA